MATWVKAITWGGRSEYKLRNLCSNEKAAKDKEASWWNDFYGFGCGWHGADVGERKKCWETSLCWKEGSYTPSIFKFYSKGVSHDECLIWGWLVYPSKWSSNIFWRSNFFNSQKLSIGTLERLPSHCQGPLMTVYYELSNMTTSFLVYSVLGVWGWNTFWRFISSSNGQAFAISSNWESPNNFMKGKWRETWRSLIENSGRTTLATWTWLLQRQAEYLKQSLTSTRIA